VSSALGCRPKLQCSCLLSILVPVPQPLSSFKVRGDRRSHRSDYSLAQLTCTAPLLYDSSSRCGRPLTPTPRYGVSLPLCCSRLVAWPPYCRDLAPARAAPNGNHQPFAFFFCRAAAPFCCLSVSGPRHHRALSDIWLHLDFDPIADNTLCSFVAHQLALLAFRHEPLRGKAACSDVQPLKPLFSNERNLIQTSHNDHAVPQRCSRRDRRVRHATVGARFYDLSGCPEAHALPRRHRTRAAG